MQKLYFAAAGGFLLFAIGCAALDDTAKVQTEIVAVCQIAQPIAVMAGTNVGTQQGWLGLAITSFCGSPRIDAGALKWLNDCVLGLEKLLAKKP